MNHQNKISTIFFDLFGVLLGVDQSVIVQYLSKLVELPYIETSEIVLGEILMRLERSEISFNTYIDDICNALPGGDRVNKDSLKNMWLNSRMGEMPAVSILGKLQNQYSAIEIKKLNYC